MKKTLKQDDMQPIDNAIVLYCITVGSLKEI